MRTVVSDGSLNAFDPKTAETMGRAFEAAWQSIQSSGGELSPLFADRIREELALRIIATAQRGERDMINLRDDAIAYVLNTAPETGLSLQAPGPPTVRPERPGKADKAAPRTGR